VIPALPSYRELLRRRDAPPGSSWGLFGDGDRLGTLNLLDDDARRAAAEEVRTGQAFSLSLPSDAISPSLAATRRPLRHHVFQRTPFHHDEWYDDFFPQYGSQLDGLRHIGHPDHGFYGGRRATDVQGPGGPLGIESIAGLPLAGRGVLIDVDRHRRDLGRPIDQVGGEALGVADLESALRAQGTDLRPGDIVLLRFGWREWYRAAPASERERVAAELVHPGLHQSHDVVGWLWDRRVAMVAADNFAVECWPARADSPFFTDGERDGSVVDPHAGIMHRALIALLGMPLGELWDLDALAAACAEDGRYSFLLTVGVLPVVGAVGSTAEAIAVR
jgi:hypothetical protein